MCPFLRPFMCPFMCPFLWRWGRRRGRIWRGGRRNGRWRSYPPSSTRCCETLFSLLYFIRLFCSFHLFRKNLNNLLLDLRQPILMNIIWTSNSGFMGTGFENYIFSPSRLVMPLNSCYFCSVAKSSLSIFSKHFLIYIFMLSTSLGFAKISINSSFDKK